MAPVDRVRRYSSPFVARRTRKGGLASALPVCGTISKSGGTGISIGDPSADMLRHAAASSNRSGQAVGCGALAATDVVSRLGGAGAAGTGDATSRSCRRRLALAPVIAVHMLAIPAMAKMMKMGTIMRRSIARMTDE